MNAVEFVKKFGWDISKQNLGYPDDVLFFQYGNCVISCNDLKLLVESYELVEKFGGLNDAKEYLKGKFIQHHESAYIKLKQAIANVEKCQ